MLVEHRPTFWNVGEVDSLPTHPRLSEIQHSVQGSWAFQDWSYPPFRLWVCESALNTFCSTALLGLFLHCPRWAWASQVMLVVKNLPTNAGDIRDAGSIPGSERSSEEGNGTPLQYSWLENSMGGEAWWATVHEAAKSQTQLSDWAHTVALFLSLRSSMMFSTVAAVMYCYSLTSCEGIPFLHILANICYL